LNYPVENPKLNIQQKNIYDRPPNGPVWAPMELHRKVVGQTLGQIMLIPTLRGNRTAGLEPGLTLSIV
jgi:hypothetical protein